MPADNRHNTGRSLSGHLTAAGLKGHPRSVAKGATRPFIVAYRNSALDDRLKVKAVFAPSCLDPAFVQRFLAAEPGALGVFPMDCLVAPPEA